MRKYIMILVIVLCGFRMNAHPGIGIVIDSKGNIFYTDLEQVWKREPDGRLTVAVPSVHTHELAIDKDDNIYGEHTWYNGERLNTWGHYVWKLHANGQVEKIKGSTPGFLDDYGFLRDRKGNVYWIKHFTVSKFMKKTPEGKITEVASGKFGDIRWSYCTPSGIIYFVDLHKLYRLTPDGKFTLIAENLDDDKKGFGFSRKHNVYGIWTDSKENIYVAILSQKKIKRITPEGKIEVVSYSKNAWSPTGGAFDSSGNLWMLEVNAANKVRIRQIPANALSAQPNFIRTVYGNYLLAFGGLAILSLVVFGIWKLVTGIKPQSKL